MSNELRLLFVWFDCYEFGQFLFVIFVSFGLAYEYLLLVWLMIVSVIIKMKFAANPIEVETVLRNDSF